MPNISRTVFLIVGASTLTAAAQVLMRWGGKHADMQQSQGILHWLWVSRWWIIGLMTGWIGGLGSAWSLRKLNINIAIPVYSGLAYLLSVLGGSLILRETMSAMQTVGILIILVGMILLSIR